MKEENLVCGGCAHYQRSEDGKQAACFRYPPTPCPVPAQQPSIATPGNNGGMSGIVVLAVRAPVGPDTIACGEFEDMVTGE